MSASIQIKRYTSQDRNEWDKFIDAAKNATFLFKRGYVDYHQHRYADHSLMIYSGNRLAALLIANETGDVVQSHGGLSYGGLILERNAKLTEVLQYFYHFLKYYSKDYRQLIYKCLPSYYALQPSMEDLYALFLLDATLTRRDTSYVCELSHPVHYTQRKRRSLKKNDQLRVSTSNDPTYFWNEILQPNLQNRYGTNPVHTLDEIRLLMSRFPENIRLHEVYDQHQLLGGTLVFETTTVAHTQYISANQAGRDVAALDLLFDTLITDVYSNKDYFSMGIFNENEGRTLNRGLMEWKHGFGANIYPLDFYSIDMSKFVALSEYE